MAKKEQMDSDEIIDKIDKFLDKQELPLEEKEKIARLMAERYWEDIKVEGEADEAPSPFDENDELVDTEEDLPPPPPRPKKKSRTADQGDF